METKINCGDKQNHLCDIKIKLNQTSNKLIITINVNYLNHQVTMNKFIIK